MIETKHRVPGPYKEKNAEKNCQAPDLPITGHLFYVYFPKSNRPAQTMEFRFYN